MNPFVIYLVVWALCMFLTELIRGFALPHMWAGDRQVITKEDLTFKGILIILCIVEISIMFWWWILPADLFEERGRYELQKWLM